MVHYYDAIPDFLSEWAMEQQIFFIASAPLTGQHINLSPKGLPASTLHVFDPNNVGYIDATGSGIETVAHMYENGRATIMFCSFDKAPRIMRWFCKGRVVEWDEPEFEGLLKKMDKKKITGARAIILLNVWKGRIHTPPSSVYCCTNGSPTVETSCGYAVPMVSSSIDPERIHEGPRAYLEDRQTLGHWAGNQIEKGVMDEYRVKMNTRSKDGCAGLKVARRQKGENLLLHDCLIWLRRTMRQREALLLGGVLAVLLMVCLRAGIEALGLRVPQSIWLLA